MIRYHLAGCETQKPARAPKGVWACLAVAILIAVVVPVTVVVVRDKKDTPVADGTGGPGPYGNAQRRLTPRPDEVRPAFASRPDEENVLAARQARALSGGRDATTGPTVDLVVARHHENSSWLIEVSRAVPSARIYIYEKGPSSAGSVCDALPVARCARLPNVGREGHTFLTHLVRHHDDLADKVVFVQGGRPGIGFYGGVEGGHLMPGTNFVLDYVDPWRPPHIVFTWAYRNLDDTELSVRRADYPFNSPPPKRETNVRPAQCAEEWVVASNATRHFWREWVDTGFLGVRADDVGPRDQRAFWETYLAHELGPPPEPFIAFANGATFSASGRALSARPVAFYEAIRRLMGRVNPLVGFYLEFFWAYIVGFEEEARACGRMVRHIRPAPTSA